MKSKITAIFLIFLKFSSIFAFPTNNDFVFPDEIDDSADDLRSLNQLRFLDDSHLLRTKNNSIEFIKDDAADVALESGKFYQGDIKLVQDQEEFLNAEPGDDRFPSRTGLVSESYRWPRSGYKSDKVHVPFIIDDEYCESS